MYIGNGWARLGFNRSGSADYYLKGAMGTTTDPSDATGATTFNGVAVAILGGATALTVVASSLVALSLTF